MHIVARSRYDRPWVDAERDDDTGILIASGSDMDAMARELAALALE